MKAISPLREAGGQRSGRSPMKRMSGATSLAGPRSPGDVFWPAGACSWARRSRASRRSGPAPRKTLKVGTYGGYFKDSFDEHIYPAFTAETGIEIESIAEPTGEAWLVQLADRGARRTRAGRRLDDGAGRAHQGPERRALGAARRGEAAQRQEPAAAFRAALPRRPDQRHRRRVLVHHAGDQHRRLPRAADLLEGALGPGQRGPAWACWRWSATRSCSRSPPRPGSAAPTSWTPRRASTRCWPSSPR